MQLLLNKKSGLDIRDQIKRQVRSLVRSGELTPGAALPSARNLAAALNVNQNTVAAAYREMVAEGILRTVVGSGTFISERQMISQSSDTLRKIFDQAIRQALESGFTLDQVSDQMLTQATLCGHQTKGRRVLVVECNRETMDHIAETLEAELGVETRGVLIQDLENNPSLLEESMAGIDLVVCGYNHVQEFHAMAGDREVEVVAVLMKRGMRMVNEILRLPAGTTVGFACANQRSTETLFQDIVLSGGSTLTKIWAGLDNHDGMQQMLDRCDVIFATGYVYDKVAGMAGPDKRIERVDLNIERENIELIKERLSLIQD